LHKISSLFVWLVLIRSERKVLLADGWFVLREKYCWLVADKPIEQGVIPSPEMDRSTGARRASSRRSHLVGGI
jgi:hypothetical protein